jgi:hypothetical protein
MAADAEVLVAVARVVVTEEVVAVCCTKMSVWAPIQLNSWVGLQ